MDGTSGTIHFIHKSDRAVHMSVVLWVPRCLLFRQSRNGWVLFIFFLCFSFRTLPFTLVFLFNFQKKKKKIIKYLSMSLFLVALLLFCLACNIICHNVQTGIKDMFNYMYWQSSTFHRYVCYIYFFFLLKPNTNDISQRHAFAYYILFYTNHSVYVTN